MRKCWNDLKRCAPDNGEDPFRNVCEISISRSEYCETVWLWTLGLLDFCTLRLRIFRFFNCFCFFFFFFFSCGPSVGASELAQRHQWDCASRANVTITDIKLQNDAIVTLILLGLSRSHLLWMAWVLRHARMGSGPVRTPISCESGNGKECSSLAILARKRLFHRKRAVLPPAIIILGFFSCTASAHSKTWGHREELPRSGPHSGADCLPCNVTNR